MFLAIEGLDGTGKSTLINNLERHLKDMGSYYDIVRITKVLKGRLSLVEKLYNRIPYIKKSIFFRRFLYAHRSNNAFKFLDKEKVKFLLGDRCIITSYISRWHKNYLLNYINIKLVDLLEYRQLIPNIVIYLELDNSIIEERLKKRGIPLDTGENDKGRKRMGMGYNAILSGKASIRRLKDTKFIRLDANKSEEDMLNIVLKLIREEGLLC